MKHFIFALLLITTTAFATSPATLYCTSTGAGPASSFELSEMNTDVPATTLDARTDGKIERAPSVTQFCANNGCDNSYCFTFFTDDLALAAKEKDRTVLGLMNYFNSDLEANAAQTVAITCKTSK